MQDLECTNILKGLVIDAVNKANSGHPGGAMSGMDLAYILYTEELSYDPDNADWIGRDRFIMSPGHMSMLLYSMLYGVGHVEMHDLKTFRQLHSKTPGHPENFMTKGVECTTGPLGSGAAMSVGFATAASHFSAHLDKKLFGYKIWTMVSDGDLQEGVALSAASMAGHLGLEKMVWIYDKNNVQLSGPCSDNHTDDYKMIFEGFGWRVLEIDGHDHKAIREAYTKARKETKKPTIIIATTIIGNGCATMADSCKTHGSPLPAEERLATKKKLGLPDDEEFYMPSDFLPHFRRNYGLLRDQISEWDARLKEKMADEKFATYYNTCFKEQSFKNLSKVEWDSSKPVATRNAFGDIIEKWAHEIPNLLGGSADLAPSNMTGAYAKAVGEFTKKNRKGRNINYGVREFPMSQLCNGMALHGGLVPFDATFLAFCDYSRPALRLGALQRVRVIHEFTHDSFHLGEDGPTHQPIEQVMAMRTIPEFYVMRPADATETEVLMRSALELDRPSALCLTRQKLPHLDQPRETTDLAAKGAYVVKDCENPNVIIFATGSEVSLALEVAENIKDTKVVSIPCWELFAEQKKQYIAEVMTLDCKKRVSIEAGTTIGWERFTGFEGLNIGIDRFGASAPANILAEEFGFTTRKITKKIEKFYDIKK
jgi:transketolase